jgi:hypothetical protein
VARGVYGGTHAREPVLRRCLQFSTARLDARLRVRGPAREPVAQLAERLADGCLDVRPRNTLCTVERAHAAERVLRCARLCSDACVESG